MFFFKKTHQRKKKPGYVVVLLLVLTLLLIPAIYTIVTRISSADATIVPIANWKFDEATGTTTSESIANANLGTLGGATLPIWQTQDQCIAGSCLYFNGSTSEVTVAGTASFKTVSMWVRPMSVTTGALADFGSNIRITVSSGVLSATGFTSPTIYVDGQASTTLVANKWQHVSVTSGTAVAGATMQFGNYSTTFLNGFIDEIRMYTDQQPAKVIKGDYTARNSARTVAAQLGQARTDALNQGLVGYWPMNESAANTCTGGTNDTCDLSGNANNGAWANNTGVIAGKFGNGTDYDGTNDSTAVSDNNLYSISNSGEFTVAAWIYPDSNAGTTNIISKGTTSNFEWSLGSSTTQTQALVWNSSGTIIGQATASTTFSTGAWQHFAMTVNQTTGVINLFKNGQKVGTGTISGTYTNGTAALRFGERADGSNDYDGRLDEVRIYNRVLSPKDIAAVYNWAAGPVGYWKMDENSGLVASDSSGNGNTGSFTAATWTKGKIGAALDSDNSDTYNVHVPYDAEFDIPATGSFTLTAWVKINGDTQFSNPQAIVNHGNGESSNGYGFVVRGLGGVGGSCAYSASGGTSVCLKISDGTDTYAISTSSPVDADGTWHHLSAVFDRTSESKTLIYVDGVPDVVSRDGTFANIGAIASAFNICIGGRSASGACTGSGGNDFTLDEVRFYSYARTSSQINEDMNGGHPLGGSPFGTQMGYWKLDDMNGTTAQDSGPNNQDLTLVSTPTWTSSGKINAGLDLETGSTQYATILDSSALSITSSVSVAAWIKPESTTAATVFPIASKGAEYALVQYGDELRLYVGSVSNYVTTANADLTTGTWYHVAGTYNAATQLGRIYVNGKEKAVTVTGTIPASITDGASNFDIGRFTGEMSSQISQSSDDARQATADTVSITGSTLESNATTEHLGFRFNTVAMPQGGTVSSAFIRLAVIDTEDEPDHTITADDVDDCATFTTTNNDIDGRADTTATATWSSTDLGAPAAGGFFNTSSIVSVAQEIVSRGGWATGNDMCFVITGSASSTRNLTVLAYDILPPVIGATFVYSTTAHTYYDGVIDEVQVYNGALTTEEVRVVANSGAASFGVLGATEESKLLDGADNPPVLWTSFDDNTGTSAVDKSGNNRTGTLGVGANNGIARFQPGKYGSGVYLTPVNAADGLNTQFGRVTYADNLLDSLTTGTVEFWFKPDDNTEDSFQDMFYSGADNAGSPNGFEIGFEPGSDLISIYMEDAASADIVATAPIPGTVTDWHYVTYTSDSGGNRLYIDGQPATITYTTGSASTQFFFSGSSTGTTRYQFGCTSESATACSTAENYWGMIDDFKVYDYARTAAQVAYDYNRGKPVGWWKMDECTGTTINNSGSGTSSNGTWSGAGGSNTTAGTCLTSGAWFNGVVGKYNSSLDFDGTDDFIDAGDPSSGVLDFGTGDFTLSIWVKYTSSVDGGFITKIDGTNIGYSLGDSGGTNKARLFIDSGNHYIDSNTSINDGAWHLIVAQRSGTTLNIFVDGKEDETNCTNCTTASDSVSTAESLKIGNVRYSGGSFFDGQLDDARIYNYALSSDQIKIVFNEGAGQRFGPLTGSP